jgi:hypothetical protein
MTMNNPLQAVIEGVSPDTLVKFFRSQRANFRDGEGAQSQYDDANFSDTVHLGDIEFPLGEKMGIWFFTAQESISEKTGKKDQYEKAKYILRTQSTYACGIFVFADDKGDFRFSLVYSEAQGTKRTWSSFRRFTYFVSRDLPNKTFHKQIGECDFSALEKIKEAFSIGAVTDIFYNEFFQIYEKIVLKVQETNAIPKGEQARDFVLLFAIRTVFLGFIQKKKWIGGDEKFLQNFFAEYKNSFFGGNTFYVRWLTPLFFEALNSEQGRKVAYGANDFSKGTEAKLQMAPFLNGGLFKQKNGYDTNAWTIPDTEIQTFFEFLFAHSFTIEENSLEDEDLQLNPEFLGIIFERLVNGENGAVYTQRTEVDLMCRLSLVKFLEENNETEMEKRDLYELFFREKGDGKEFEEDQKEGSFSLRQIENLLEMLENIVICDPAVGSGAFPVGMMQVLDEVEQSLRKRIEEPHFYDSAFERKKRIIAKSLYGVEVKEWAVWICQLRLWLSLFVDAPDELKNSPVAILPSLEFKIRCGDSLVQCIAGKNFPVDAHAHLSAGLKSKITKLKNAKTDFFLNKSKDAGMVKQQELQIFRDILEDELFAKRQKVAEQQNKKNIVAEQGNLFGEDGKMAKTKQISLFEAEIEMLKIEIAELEKQKNLLSTDTKPLIWNIEFAEIFSEKGGFDIVIGNPPYIRQEEIGDPKGKLENLEYKEALVEMIRDDFWDSNKTINDFKKISGYDGRTDLSVYFYFRAIKLLNPSGITCFICTNSWLDTGYGGWLQKFLLEKVPLHFIIDNHAKRSFAGASINTIISVFGSANFPHDKVGQRGVDVLKFVAFKKPFEEVIFTENLLEMENAKTTLANEKMRILPMNREKLMEEGQGDDPKTYAGDKWGGKYLRAPDIFWTILEKGKEKLVKLGSVAEVRFGIKTGANDFFYLDEEKIAEWKIEPEFLKKTIFSFKEIKSIIQENIDFRFSLFWCPFSKIEIEGTNALKYIEWGEKQSVIIKQGGNKGDKIIGFQNIKSCSGRKYWYGFSQDWKPADLIFNSKIGERFLVYKNTCGYFEDKKLYGIFLKDNNQIDNLALVLNTTISRLILELFSSELTGAQAIIDVTVNVVDNLIIFNPLFFDLKNSPIFDRPIKSIFEECGIDPLSPVPISQQTPKPLPDRAQLDDIVFDALGLSDDERTEIYRAVCQLVWNRVKKSKSV